MAANTSGVSFTDKGMALGGANVANVVIDASAATDAFALPVGTIAERPEGANGYIRYNDEIHQFEGFKDGNWSGIGGAVVIQNNNVFVNSTSTIDFSNGDNIILSITDDYANGRVNVWIDSVGGSGRVAIGSDTFTSTAGQNTFYLSANVAGDNLSFVTRNGILQVPSDHYTVNGNVLTFTTNCVVGELIESRNFFAFTGIIGIGDRGPMGDQGIQGFIGTQGFGGVQGTQGTFGTQGVQGTTGIQGSFGTQGVQGHIGVQGVQGTLGIQGSFGSQGTQGVAIQGQAGTAQGTQGAFGLQGTQGTQGVSIQGQAGSAQGTQGTQGPLGIGSQGIQGTLGVQGVGGTSQGTQGTQGAGSVGSQGIQGTQGVGSPGVQGIQGTLGVQGLSGTSQGTQGTTGSGTQGVQGTLGVQGIGGTSQGTQGTTGSQGSQGTIGTQGSQGVQGEKGSQGSQGTQGLGTQGVQGTQGTGSTGSQGVQGTLGTTGSQGLTGTGSQGTQGAGSVGTQGTQGTTGTGTQGVQGSLGLQGTQGAGTAGTQGVQGQAGTAQGTQGTLGIQGATGSGTGGGGGTSKVTVLNLSLGSQNYNTSYTYYTVANVAQRGIVSYFYVTANVTGLFDIVVRGSSNDNGSLMLAATDISSNNYTMSYIFYYENDDVTSNSVFIGIKNRGGVSQSYNLASLRIEKFA